MDILNDQCSMSFIFTSVSLNIFIDFLISYILKASS